jgi:hypothetical protein
MYCFDDASCHLKDCGAGCTMECDGKDCELDTCGSGCSIGCYGGKTCHIGVCTGAGCAIRTTRAVSGSGAEPSTQIIDSCVGGFCQLDCKSGDICSIGECAGGDCLIHCAEGATCTCPDTGCMVVETPATN